MSTVRQLLESKGTEVISVSPDSNVLDALKLMAQREIGAVLVVEGTRLVGIMSERDYARKVILKGKSSQDTRVREIMTERVMYARPEHHPISSVLTLSFQIRPMSCEPSAKRCKPKCATTSLKPRYLSRARA